MHGMEKMEMAVSKASPLAASILCLEQNTKDSMAPACVTWIHEAAGLVFYTSTGLKQVMRVLWLCCQTCLATSGTTRQHNLVSFGLYYLATET